MSSFEDHCRWVADCILVGELTPFLGAGINLCDRPSSFKWQFGNQQYLPSGVELAAHLAHEFQLLEPTIDLARTAQHAAVLKDTKDLYGKLNTVFRSQYPTTSAHEFLASLPRVVRQLSPAARYQLIVTTNYDDLMEAAFADAGEPFDLLIYEAEGLDKGKFWHRAPSSRPTLIKKPNSYPYPFLKDRPVLMKIHGSIDRSRGDRDSYVITEDHYIEYLANRPLEQIIPITLLDHIRNSHLLFLGYSLRDWNLRVFLRRLTQTQRLQTKHWAVLLNVGAAEQKLWRSIADIEVWPMDLRAYFAGLKERLFSPEFTKGE